VGANDELIFDGYSHAVDSEGRALDWLPAFEEAVGTFNLDRRGGEEEFPRMEEMEGVRRALVLGLRDYLRKTGFEKAVLGLSGGIDSALTAAIAVDALGPENVQGVTMPSMHSSSGSVTDSQQLAMNLGIALDEIPIRPIYEQFMEALEPAFRGTEPGVAEENIQARIRGDLLMAYSNKFGSILLSTGNKSELAVGYSTLYGDMNGGLAVLSDLPKTTVYELARWYNREGEVIPEATITKPPSAELAPDQEDQDTLPPYDVLDPILELYIEEGKGIPQIVEQGYDEEVVRWVVHAVNGNEYKRKQMAPGLRVTTKAFGAGRRMPIAARFD
jgi:NAD+ synthase (glutamine-hydrolysing)